MIYEGTLDENKMEQIPHRWRDTYKRNIKWLVREWAGIDKELVIPGPRLPEPQDWTLRKVATAVAEARKPEERHPRAVWQALTKLELPRKVERVVHTILWKKLPVAERMKKMQMSQTPDCPLCGAIEDHEHRVKKCKYLDRPILIIRGMYSPTTTETGHRIQPSSLDMPEMSLQTEQGIFMWTAITALWRYRCEV